MDCAAVERGHPEEHQGRSERQFHGSAGDVYPCAEHNNWWVPYCTSCAGLARVADFPRSCWLALLVLGAAATGQLSRSGRSWCCNRSTAATSRGQVHHAIFMSNWTSGPRRPVNFVQIVGGSDRVCRRAGTSGGRLHPIHVRRCPEAGPDCRGRRPRRGIRAQVSTAALSRHADSCSRPSISDISVTPRLGKTRPPSRSPTIFRESSMSILQLLPQTRQVFMVMGSGQIGQFWRRELENQFRRFHDRLTFVWFDNLSASGDPAPLCEPARQLGDLLCDFRHGCGRGSVCGRAGARRAPRRGQCAPVCGAQRVPGSGSRRRIAAVHRRPQSQHGRRGRSTLERRAAEQHQSDRYNGPGQPTFDWRELQRWGIPESRLPAGSVVRYRGPSLWQRIQGHGAERGRRAGRPIAPDRRARVPAPRTPQGRDREPEEPGARRRRQPPPDDGGADQLDCPRARSTAQCDDSQRPGAADDGHRESCAVRHDWRRSCPISRPRAVRRRKSSIAIGRCCEVVSWT